MKKIEINQQSSKQKKHFYSIKQMSINTKILVIFIFSLIFIGILTTVSIVGMSIISSARAYIAGEGFYARGQKNAVVYLLQYSTSHNESDYMQFLEAIKIPLADRDARLELDKSAFDHNFVRQALINGRNHPDDVDSMIRIARWMGSASNVNKAFTFWKKADEYNMELKKFGADLHDVFSKKPVDNMLLATMVNKITMLNKQSVSLQEKFSVLMNRMARNTQENVQTFI
ncbi:MAG: hypothetical protein JJV89_03040 [Desulfosarcina sp.]|nr:hypothetical protein [Desulfobacterales bacterium]